MISKREWLAKGRALSWAPHVGFVLLALAWFWAVCFATETWNVLQVWDAGVWSGGVILTAGLLWLALRERARVALLGVAVAYFVIGVGSGECIAVAFLLVGCRELGVLLLAGLGRPQRDGFEVTRPAMIGLACFVALFAVMVRDKGNHDWKFGLALAAPMLVRMALRKRLSVWDGEIRAIRARFDAIERIPYGAWVGVILLVGMVCRFAFLPTIGADDAVLHLMRASQLQTLGQFRFDVAANVWAVAPYSVDMLHAVVSLMARSDARAVLNLALFLLLLRQLHAVSQRLELAEGDRWLLVALFASAPLVGWQLVTLQTELFVALLAACCVRFSLRMAGDDTLDIGDVATVAAAAALAAATKINAGFLGALFGVAVIVQGVRIYRGRGFNVSPGGWLFSALLLAVFAHLAIYPYFEAWRVAGNPLFPLFNKVFCAPQFPCANFSDTRWRAGFSLASYAAMFFRTHEYGEVRDGVAGFQYLILLPAGLVALFARRPLREALGVAAPLLVFGGVMFWQMQYLRYLFPVTPLASAAIAAILIPTSQPRQAWLLPLARAGIALCLCANMVFFPGTSWLFRQSLQDWYTSDGRDAARREFTPVLSLNDYLNAKQRSLRVLYPREDPAGATLHGEPIYVNWYSTGARSAFDAIHDEASARAFLAERRVDYVIISPSRSNSLPERVMADYLTKYGRPEIDIGGYVVSRVADKPLNYASAFSFERTAATPSLVATLTPKTVATVQVSRASVARFRFEYRCSSDEGYYIAQVNWDVGAPYYRLAPCSAATTTFVDAAPIPVGAHEGQVYVTTYGNSGAEVDRVTMETD